MWTVWCGYLEPAFGRQAGGGVIVSFSGVDGSGKTTLAKALADRHAGEGAVLVEPYRRSLFLSAGRVVGGGRPRRNLIWAIARNVFFTIDILLLSPRVRRARRRRRLVICDRYLYDTLAHLEEQGALPGFLKRLYLRLIPAPDVAFLLDVDSDTARQREAAHSDPSYYGRKRAIYENLAADVPFVRVNTRADVASTGSEIEKVLEEYPRRLRVLWISRKYPPSIGGMQEMNFRLTKALEGKTKLSRIVWGGSQVFLPFFLISATVRGTWRCLRRPKPQVIVLGDALLAPLGLWLKRVGRVPVAAIAHGLDVTFPSPHYQKIVPGALKRLDRVVCVSRHTESECQNRGIQKTVVIPNGVGHPAAGTKETSRRALESSLGFSLNGHAVLLSLGRLVPRKGVEPFVREVVAPLSAEGKNFVYLIAGEGPERGAVEAAIKRLGLSGRVRLLGRVSDEIRAHLYRASDWFVMPNICVPGDAEGFGLVALEAASYGLPVIASSVDGITDSVGDGEGGILIPARDPLKFRQELARCLDHPQAQREFSRKAAAHAERFDWDSIASRYHALIEELA